jgi:hypothetical protein
MKKIFLIGLVSIGLAGCTASNFGFYTRRTQNAYDLMVGGAVPAPEDTFYRGAYEVCKREHNSGFVIERKELKRTTGGGTAIEGSFKCEGQPDKFLTEKYAASPAEFAVEDSNLAFQGGKKYTLRVPQK